ncbi:hypothetical protein GCM10022631_05010 [Deinococcus rubellus]|uniref:Uncharacterized protein n=1 Tax=Deinococcus rubellus TaxID=1889240 RepID=A0ABY5YIH5_9DEIO|nr:hypothetical protein [Deinococcus rubellus]UWX64147.1 hypothetical protein N0D28_00245 [Deinococcus rubellus]
MTRQDWRELWHRTQDQEQLTEREQQALGGALADAAQRREAEGWERAAALLRRADPPKLPHSVAHSVVRDIALNRTLSAPLTPQHSHAADTARNIALSRRLGPGPLLERSVAADVAARIAGDASETDPLAALLRQWPAPELPRSLAGAVAARVAREAHPEFQPSPRAALCPAGAPEPNALPPLGRTRLNPPGGPSGLGGLGVVLAFAGLTLLRGNPAAQKTLGLLSQATPFALPLSAVLGVAALALLSWLIVARPTPAVRQLGALGLAMTGVVTLPAVWDALQNTPLRSHLAALGTLHPAPQLLMERCLGAGLLLGVTALLLGGGWSARLARRQRRAPVQTLAAGTLAGLGLSGLGLMLVSFGWTEAGLGLGLLSALAALIGLSVSLSAAGRSVARRLQLALPDVSGPLAGLLAFSATLSVPALAAGLAVIGSVWGLGTLLLGREAAQV